MNHPAPVVDLESGSARVVSAACIGGASIDGVDPERFLRRLPTHWQTVQSVVHIADADLVARAGANAHDAAAPWARRSPEERATILRDVAIALEEHCDDFALLIADEIGKPVGDGRAEIAAGASFFRAAAGAITQESIDESSGPDTIAYRPHGVVGLITPWNNPLLIPAGKLAPALGWGNAVVWKPAIEAPRTALGLLDLLHDAGVSCGVVNLVFGGAPAAMAVIDLEQVKAVSLTGSSETGRTVAAQCLRRGIPFQGELGGNNAAIIHDDFDYAPALRDMARSAYSCAGQRCTAMRRWIINRTRLEAFIDAFAGAAKSLRIGDPRSEEVDIGPLVSKSQQDRVRQSVEHAIADGARVVTGGEVPSGLDHGCWWSPTLLVDVSPEAWIARTETFGPLAMILPVDDLEEALMLANDVEQGLVAAFYGHDRKARQHFAEHIQSGILQFEPGPIRVRADLPFGGWKASGVGPPEHGDGDRVFYSRPQARYGL